MIRAQKLPNIGLDEPDLEGDAEEELDDEPAKPANGCVGSLSNEGASIPDRRASDGFDEDRDELNPEDAAIEQEKQVLILMCLEYFVLFGDYKSHICLIYVCAGHSLYF